MIFARSPYIVTIDETGQESTRLELFIWNGTGAAPLYPSYSLSKQVPSINNIETYYNISPFLREYFDFTQSDPTVVGTDDPTNIYAYCNVTWKTYYSIDGVETLLDTNTDKVFDGYGLYENGSNYAGQNIFLSNRSSVGGSNVYNYPCVEQSNCDIINVSFSYGGVNYSFDLIGDGGTPPDQSYEYIGGGYTVTIIPLETGFFRFEIQADDEEDPLDYTRYGLSWEDFPCPKSNEWEYVQGEELENFTTLTFQSGLLSAAGLTLLTGAAGTNNYWIARYTDLLTLDVSEVNLPVNSVYDVLRVFPNYLVNGNKLEILNGNEVVQDTYYFIPQCECKYEIMTCDFINKWGAWQREFFYKASTESVEMSNTQYKLNPTDFPNYNLYEGQTKNFNTNAKRSIKVNTGWVEENYKVTIEEMLLSETIRINGLPAVLKTKSVEKFKSINTKTINYQMEFEMAYDVINTIS